MNNETEHESSPKDVLIRQAIRMIGDQDLCHWSDAHDRVTLEALRDLLSAPPQPTERSAELEALLAVKEHAEFDAARRDPSVLRGQLLTILDICNTAIAAAPQKGEAA